MNERFYVYRHVRNDTGEVFYVGKGANRLKRRPDFERAFTMDRVNKWWHAVVAKHGCTVEILCLCQTDDEAAKKERFFISLYGRKEDGGSLVNQTDGGDGRSRGYFSPEERAKRSAQSKGRKLTAEHGRKISASKKGIATSIQKGDTLPEWWKDRIRQTKFGERNPMFGRTGARHPSARRVVDSATGQEFATVTAAAEDRGIPMKSLHNMLTGFRNNLTTLKFHAS